MESSHLCKDPSLEETQTGFVTGLQSGVLEKDECCVTQHPVTRPVTPSVSVSPELCAGSEEQG